MRTKYLYIYIYIIIIIILYILKIIYRFQPQRRDDRVLPMVTVSAESL